MIALTERAERRRAASTRSTRSETIESYPSTGLEDFRGGIRFADTGSLSVTKISAFYFPSFSDSLLKSTAGLLTSQLAISKRHAFRRKVRTAELSRSSGASERSR